MRENARHGPSQSAAFPSMVSGPEWPKEYLCPISKQPMSDPVTISTGQTYERNCILAWLESGQTHCFISGDLLSGDNPFSLIPNRCLSSTIQRFCQYHGVSVPPPTSISDARRFVNDLIHPLPPSPPVLPSAPLIEPRIIHTETFVSNTDPNIPLSFRRPTPSISSCHDGGDVALAILPSSFTQRLRSFKEDKQEEAARELRFLTRTDVSSRKIFASDESFLDALLDLTASSGQKFQSDCVATLLNLSLEKENKVRLMRAGALESLMEVLRGGYPEARGHAAAAIFSLAVEEENRTVIAVIGAIPPLLRLLGSGGDPIAAGDAAMALYYLSLQKVNKSKMVRAGAVPILARCARDSAQDGEKGFGIRARCFMIMGSLAVEEEGRKALLGSDALMCARGTIEKGSDSDSVEQHALAFMLVMVGRGRVRLVDSGPESSLTRAVRKLAALGTDRTKEKAVALLRVLKEAHAAEYGEGGGDGGLNPPDPPPSLGQGGYLGDPVGRATFAAPNRVAGF